MFFVEWKAVTVKGWYVLPVLVLTYCERLTSNDAVVSVMFGAPVTVPIAVT